MPSPYFASNRFRVSYPGAGVEAVAGVDVDVEPGEFVSIVGESGSGKTTLVLGALGLLPPSARVTGGRITYSDVDVTGWSGNRMSLVRGNFVGFIPQDPNTSLNPVKRIGRQVVEALQFNLPKSARQRATHLRAPALDALRTAGLAAAERVFDQYPHELSGGMKQRALIAIALAAKPKLIIADEPTSALDVTVQRAILNHLSTLQQELGIGILLVTHDLGVALERSDRIVVMRRGRVVDEGTPLSIRNQPRDEYTRQLLDSAPSRHSTRLAPSVQVPVDNAGPVLVAADVSKAYAARLRGRGHRIDALSGVGLTLRRGTTHAVVGESGAGKSTLARIIAGLGTPDSGSITVGDKDLTTLGRAELRAMRRNLQFVYQNPFTSLDPRYTVGRVIAEPLQAFGVGDKGRRRAQVLDLLDAVSLDRSFVDRLPSELSGGQRQRVAIARALALEPEIVILDEAVSALDVSVQAQILRLLVDLQGERALSYVFVTHDLGVVRMIADDVTVMRGGRVLETGPADTLFAAPQHDYTRTLIAAIPDAEARVSLLAGA